MVLAFNAPASAAASRGKWLTAALAAVAATLVPPAPKGKGA